MSERIEGFFLSFDEEEIKDVKEELVAQGYTGDSAGLKAFLMEMLFAESEEVPDDGRTDEVIGRVQNFIRENPQTVEMGLNLVAGMLKKVIKKPS